MKHAVAGVFLLCLAHGAPAADPPPRTAEKPVAAAIVEPAPPAKAEPAKAEPRKLLNLRIGDVRKYMTPQEYEALINPQVEERNTVIVKADAPLVPMKSELDVPGGVIAPFWALANPLSAWRIFAPDPRFKDGPPPENKVPWRATGLGPQKPGE